MKLGTILLLLFSSVALAQVNNPTTDATLQTSDITTNNFSTTKHGFVPKGTNTGNCLKDNGSWGSCGTGSGFTSIGTLDSLTKSANGASSTGTSLVMQTADATNPGLISVGTQTVSGDKTVNLTASTVSSSVLFSNTISGTTTFGGTLTNNGVISGGIVSATTLRGVISVTDSLTNGTWNNPTISGTTTLGGAINGAAAVITSPVVSGSGTVLGGTLTNNGIITSGIIKNGTVSNTTMVNDTFSQSNTFGGVLTQNTNWLPVSGAGMDFSLGGVSPTTTSTTTVSKILKEMVYGTWTPSFKGGTSDPSAITYSAQVGHFYKMNAMVCLTFNLALSAITGGGGTLSVSGLPYVVTTTSTQDFGGMTMTAKSGWTTNGPDYFAPLANTHSMNVDKNNNTGNSNINVNNLSTTSAVYGTGCYITTE